MQTGVDGEKKCILYLYRHIIYHLADEADVISLTDRVIKARYRRLGP